MLYYIVNFCVNFVVELLRKTHVSSVVLFDFLEIRIYICHIRFKSDNVADLFLSLSLFCSACEDVFVHTEDLCI